MATMPTSWEERNHADTPFLADKSDIKGEKVVDQIDFTVGSRGPERTCSGGGVT
jgi:hypothetical protein